MLVACWPCSLRQELRMLNRSLRMLVACWPCSLQQRLKMLDEIWGWIIVACWLCCLRLAPMDVCSRTYRAENSVSSWMSSLNVTKRLCNFMLECERAQWWGKESECAKSDYFFRCYGGLSSRNKNWELESTITQWNVRPGSSHKLYFFAIKWGLGGAYS